MARWERERILIWGKTRPELSRSYRETVCTGGIFADSRRLVRLYPIPLRFLDDEKVFRKYQWIEAYVTKAHKDPRPESYHIRPDSIEVGEFIAAEDGDWGRRAEWLMRSENVFRSVEALQEAREREGTSLGFVKPREVNDFLVEALSGGEKEQFWRKYNAIQGVRDLPFEPEQKPKVKPLRPPDYRFRIKFRCDDPACPKDHVFTVFDWEVDALYFKCRSRGDAPEQAREKVVAKLRGDVCSEGRDTYFFLGNILAHPHKFTIVGLWYPKKRRPQERTLFD
jgi:hypothetical protein